jgi:hypothetical protein
MTANKMIPASRIFFQKDVFYANAASTRKKALDDWLQKEQLLLCLFASQKYINRFSSLQGVIVNPKA